MIDKMHSELIYYKNNKDKFRNKKQYFEKLYCNLYNLYQNETKKFYEIIKKESKNKNQIIEIINSIINFFIIEEKFEICMELKNIREDINKKLDLIFK